MYLQFYFSYGSQIQFLSRVSILTRDIDVANLFYCLSLSVRLLRSGIV